jgi:hypothetical protein
MNPAGSGHAALIADLTRRRFLQRAGALGVGALALSAGPAARALAQLPLPAGDPDATLQAFADTIIPGRGVDRTDLGNAVAPGAIAGVDPLPGAVEADALALYHHPETGFDALQGPFLADVQSRAASRGADFLHLSFDDRVQVCLAGLSFDNPARVLWEAAAAVPFTAFCAAALIPEQTAAKASGYRVMGLPGAAPNGYSGFSYGKALSRERTADGSLD